MSVDSNEGLMSVKSCAELLSVSEGTVRNWVKDNPDFPNPVNVPGKRVLLSKSEVHEFLKKVLLEERRIAPLASHSESRNDSTRGMSEEQKIVHENRRMNRNDDWADESQNESEWDWDASEEGGDNE